MGPTQAGQLLRRNWGLAGMFAILVASLAANVVLGLRLRGWTPPQALKQGGVQENSFLPPIPVVEEDGSKSYLRFDSGCPCILYVLSPTCSWCRRNQRNIETLASAVKSKYRIDGLSVAENRPSLDLQSLGMNFASQHGEGSKMAFHVHYLDSPDLMKQLGLYATPQTVIVGADGIVKKVWVGAYLEDRRKEIEQFFGIRLPGISLEE